MANHESSMEQVWLENAALASELTRMREVNRKLLSARVSAPRGRQPVRLTRRLLCFEPTSQALFKLHSYALEGRERRYDSRLNHALGHLAVVDDATVVSLYTHVLSFAQGASSLAGLESLFLSSMHTVWQLGYDGLYNVGIEMWRTTRRSRDRVQMNDGGIAFLDRSTNILTFVPWRQADALGDKLLGGGFFGPHGIAGAIRDPRGYADDNPNGYGYSKCLATCTATIAISMGIGGAIGGGMAGGGVPGGAAGFKSMAELGAIVGGAGCAWYCEDDKPAPPEQKQASPSSQQSGSNTGASNSAPSAPASPQDAGTQSQSTSSNSSSSSSSTSTPQPTEKEQQQQQSLPEEHPNQSRDPCDNCSSGATGSYPNPDDDGPGSPLAQRVEALSFPTPDGEPGGPAGRQAMVATARSFLLHELPRLGNGNTSLAIPGLLKNGAF